MAKKKDVETAVDSKPGGGSRDELVRKTLLDLEKLFGRKLNKSGREILEEKEVIIPFSPSLDIGLGGGIPEGSWVSVAGPAKHGKTTSILSFAANAQKEQFGNRPIFFLVPENFRNLLENAETLARWVESLTGGVR